MKRKKHILTVIAIVTTIIFCLAGCGKSVNNANNKSSNGVNPNKIEGTWKTVNVGIDGSIFTFEELDNMGESYVEETSIIFKDGGKAVVVIPEDNYSTMYNWEKTGENEWTMSDDFEEFKFVKEENKLVMQYDDYDEQISLYFEKVTDEQIVPTISDEDENKENVKNETAEKTVTSAENPIDIHKAMDEYEAFFDKYIAFMKEYESSDDPSEYMEEYDDYMDQYTKTMDALYSIDTETLSDEDWEYYTEVINRITEKLIDNEL